MELLKGREIMIEKAKGGIAKASNQGRIILNLKEQESSQTCFVRRKVIFGRWWVNTEPIVCGNNQFVYGIWLQVVNEKWLVIYSLMNPLIKNFLLCGCQDNIVSNDTEIASTVGVWGPVHKEWGVCFETCLVYLGTCNGCCGGEGMEKFDEARHEENILII